MLEISKSSLVAVDKLRTAYLNSLPFFQEIWLEFLIMDAGCYDILFNNRKAGYAIVSPENILLEFFLEKDADVNYAQAFQLVTENLHIKIIYCKSFDKDLFSHCSWLQLERKIVGYMYRECTETEVPQSTLSNRYADMDDLDFLAAQDDEVFEPKELLPSMIDKKSIILFYENDIIAACGFLTRIHENRKYYDIGMWVSQAFRRKGYGNYVFAFLKNHCISNHIVPVCGCSADNKISKKIIENNGYTSRHELIEFNV